MRRLAIGAIVLAAAVGTCWQASGQGRQSAADLVAAQKKAMQRLSMMDGVWRGPAWTVLPSGEKRQVTQTERAGPFLDGAVKVVEGRGYEADGRVAFNALGVISYDPDKDRYSMRSYAQGRTGDFTVTPTDKGFRWEIPAGPVTLRYSAEISDGTWKEVGDRVSPGGEPVRFFEMTLKRVEDTTWPADGAVKPE